MDLPSGSSNSFLALPSTNLDEIFLLSDIPDQMNMGEHLWQPICQKQLDASSKP
jgi:hypothetical protein